MTRIREVNHHLSLLEGVTSAANATGSTIGILMGTFMVRTLLIPSTVLLGRFNWWPSRLSRPDQAPSVPPEPEPEQAASPW